MKIVTNSSKIITTQKLLHFKILETKLTPFHENCSPLQKKSTNGQVFTNIEEEHKQKDNLIVYNCLTRISIFFL